LTDLTDRDGSISSPSEESIRTIGVIGTPERVQLSLDQTNQTILKITADPQNPFSKECRREIRRGGTSGATKIAPSELGLF
jgi:hypothetical protein